MIITGYGIVAALFWLAYALYLLINRQKVRFLYKSKIVTSNPLPSVVIIIAIRNEETHLAEALQSVCNLSYSNFNIAVVNDRSTDRTASILKTFADQYPHITIHTIETLPDGWLGKNHALYTGYKNSTEDWLLFTDADVVFATDTVDKAIGYTLQNSLQHLTVLPAVQSPSKLLNGVLATFLTMLETRQRPWAVRNPASTASLGVGAFNMVTRKAYEEIGTHKIIALRPDDDLKLGEHLKKSGFRSDAVYGLHQISLEWYANIGEFINGLMKNAFSVFNYRLARAIINGVIPVMLLFVLPIPILLLFGGPLAYALATCILLFQGPLFWLQRGNPSKWWYPFAVPYAGALMAYIMLRAAIKTLRQKGIYWRGSFYPLSELRKQR